MAQLSCLGVPMPLQKGWMEKLYGKTVSDDMFTRFMSLKDAHLRVSVKHEDPPSPKPTKAQVDILKYRAAAAIATGGPIGSRTITCKEKECAYPYCRCV